MMARPLKEGIDYFPHDTNAFNDVKIKMLRAIHKNDGYVFYFYLLEEIYKHENFQIDLSDENLRNDMILCFSIDLGIDVDKFNQILSTCLKYNLFDADLYNKENKLSSNGIQKRAKTVVDKRLSSQERYNKNKSKSISATETTPETTISATDSQGFCHVSAGKEKESKENQSSKEKKDCVTSHADDDDFLNDFSEEEKETISRLSIFGLHNKESVELIKKYPIEFINLKLNQITEQNKINKIANMKAYTLQAFRDAEFECNYEMDKIESAKKKAIEKKMADELKAKTEREEQEKQDEFMRITDELLQKADKDDIDNFFNKRIKGSKSLEMMYNKSGVDGIMISGLFRDFLYQKEFQEQGA